MGYLSLVLHELIKTENRQLRETYKEGTEEVIRELSLIREKLDNLSKQLEHISSQANSTGDIKKSGNSKIEDEIREPDEDNILSLKELSGRYPFTPGRLAKLARQGKFPRITVGKEYKVRLTQFDHWYKTCGIYYADRSVAMKQDKK